MPDWLHASLNGSDTLPPTEVLFTRVLLSVLCGFVVAGVYRLCLGRRRDESRTLATTLVLLTVLLAMVTVVIGNSVARAFGLVGALSIVRFRTVVEDTRDTAFVIFSVVVGMATGAGDLMLLAVGIPAVTVSGYIMAYFDWRQATTTGRRITLTVRIGLGHSPETLLVPRFEPYLTEVRLMGAATARQGAALELTYSARLRRSQDTFPLVADLNQIEGVQNVEIREHSS